MLLLFSSLPLFLWYHFFPAWHKGTCVASLSWRPSKFICLSLMAISHCHNTKLPTIDRECLFNHDSSSSSLSPSVWLRLAFMHALLLVCRWPSSCGFTALGLHSGEGGFDALCQVILSLGKSAMGYGKMALTCLHTGSDGWLPVSIAALMAQGPCLLVLSETCSCPNRRQGSVSLYLRLTTHLLSPDTTTVQMAKLLMSCPISGCKTAN